MPSACLRTATTRLSPLVANTKASPLVTLAAELMRTMRLPRGPAVWDAALPARPRCLREAQVLRVLAVGIEDVWGALLRLALLYRGTSSVTAREKPKSTMRVTCLSSPPESAAPRLR